MKIILKPGRFLTQAETPIAEPGQKSVYKENNTGAINKDKLNRIHRRIIGRFTAEWDSSCQFCLQNIVLSSHRTANDVVPILGLYAFLLFELLN